MDSNQRPAAYEAAALPAELRSRVQLCSPDPSRPRPATGLRPMADLPPLRRGNTLRVTCRSTAARLAALSRARIQPRSMILRRLSCRMALLMAVFSKGRKPASNRRPPRYEGGALPSELLRRSGFLLQARGGHRTRGLVLTMDALCQTELPVHASRCQCGEWDLNPHPSGWKPAALPLELPPHHI